LGLLAFGLAQAQCVWKEGDRPPPPTVAFSPGAAAEKAVTAPSWGLARPNTPPQSVSVRGDAALLAVHVSVAYDARYATKRGADAAARLAREQGISRIFLRDDTDPAGYFMADCDPDHWVFSEGGELRFPLDVGQLTAIGGHLELCLSTALHDVLLQWSRLPPRDRTVTLPMDAIYSNGKVIDPQDSFYEDFMRFMGVVTYARPGGEHWPKLTLLESMGIIKNPVRQADYLRQVLPRWDRTFDDSWRVVMVVNEGPLQVLRPGRGLRAPTLRFHFIDSAGKALRTTTADG
ncbi:MAG: hypothetical protein RLZ83_916, partial [Pseudomonadota bacterium]